MEQRRLIITGNSYSVTIPRKFLRILRASGGDYVTLFMADKDTLVIRKSNPLGRRKSDA